MVIIIKSIIAVPNRHIHNARTNCARRRTFGPIYTTTHEDSGGGSAHDCRCWYRRRRYSSWNGSKSRLYRIDQRSMPGWPTDVVEYGRLNRRSNSTSNDRCEWCDSMRYGAARCKKPESQSWCDSPLACTTDCGLLYSDNVR